MDRRRASARHGNLKARHAPETHLINFVKFVNFVRFVKFVNFVIYKKNPAQ